MEDRNSDITNLRKPKKTYTLDTKSIVLQLPPKDCRFPCCRKVVEEALEHFGEVLGEALGICLGVFRGMWGGAYLDWLQDTFRTTQTCQTSTQN